jgi:uncharacterized protein YbbC (DUF1343 family)
MIESNDMVDPLTGVPVFSLYGKTRRPTREMLDLIDVLLVDLQDVGTRVYTFIYTMAYCMEAAGRFGKKVMVLDRPNPIGGCHVEGNLLEPSLTSFVGLFPIPMRHGLTICELALLFKQHFGIDCDLSVIPMAGWNRAMYFSETGLPWVAPSPNLPVSSSALPYPGQVIWEGTNVSEGRGTTQPFEFVGAPFFNQVELLNFLKDDPPVGVFLRPTVFEPTSNKWAGAPCCGFQLHVTDPDSFNAYGTGLRLLRAALALYGDNFSWKSPPYEYDYNHLPIDLILGDKTVRERLETLEPVSLLEDSFREDLSAFDKKRRDVMMYQEGVGSAS